MCITGVVVGGVKLYKHLTDPARKEWKLGNEAYQGGNYESAYQHYKQATVLNNEHIDAEKAKLLSKAAKSRAQYNIAKANKLTAKAQALEAHKLAPPVYGQICAPNASSTAGAPVYNPPPLPPPQQVQQVQQVVPAFENKTTADIEPTYLNTNDSAGNSNRERSSTTTSANSVPSKQIPITGQLLVTDNPPAFQLSQTPDNQQKASLLRGQ